MMSVKRYIARNLINVRGFRTDRKLVVIESDDWGSIRMPSKSVYSKLQADGCHPESDPYMKFDALESDQDLMSLFDLLRSVRDQHGRHAVLTANAVMANPDFERIKKSGFNEYFYERFTETLQKYEGRQQVFRLWKQGMEEHIFVPQFHGREHLHIKRWMSDLFSGDVNLRKAFDLNMLSISSVPGKMRFGYMEGLDHCNEAERVAKVETLVTGHQLFIDLVGYPSKTFIANCYIWDDTVEQALRPLGVKVMQGIFNQIKPDGQGGHSMVRHYTGQQKNGMIYTVRNVFFEPSLEPDRDWVDEALSRINTAFIWKKPAIIGSHRLNYIGSIHPQNRETNLKTLGQLLQRIVRKWPEVEFVSSSELADILVNQS